MLTPAALADVQANLKQTFQAILNQGYAATQGNRFDNAVAECLEAGLRHTPGYACEGGARLRFKTVSAAEFSDRYPEHKARCARQDFNFQDLIGPLTLPGGVPVKPQPDLLIVRQPNGSQNWPDLLVIANGIGLPIEVKSDKDSTITWNGGIPRPGRLYVFNSRAGHKPGISTGTTIFMGDAITDAEEVEALLAHHEEQHERSKAFNAKMAARRAEKRKAELAGNPAASERPFTDYYDRAMYRNNANYFRDPAVRRQREEEALAFVEAYHALPPPPAPVVQPRRRLR